MARPDPIRERKYRLTRYSVFPILLILSGVGWELYALLYRLEGGPFSHVFWWAYGARYSLRWWLLSCGFTGFSAWCCWHFALRWPGLPQLVALVAVGLVLGWIGWLVS